MPTKLSDHRESAIQTLEDAASLFNDIASTEIKIARAKAMAEARIAKIKEQTAEKIEQLDPDLTDKQAALAEYIDAHPEEFQKPRKVKTDFGTFGLHAAKKLNWLNKKAALAFLVDQDMVNCFETSHKPVSKGIEAAIEAGSKIPGVGILDGDIAHYTVKRALINEAKEV